MLIKNKILISSNATNPACFALRGVIDKGVLDHVEVKFRLEKKSNRKEMNRDLSNQKANLALKTKSGN